jgi:hypothetical protein
VLSVAKAKAKAMDRGWIPACVGTVDAEVLGWPGAGRRQVDVCRAGRCEVRRSPLGRGAPLREG